jgi:hypothetical protein
MRRWLTFRTRRGGLKHGDAAHHLAPIWAICAAGDWRVD